MAAPKEPLKISACSDMFAGSAGYWSPVAGWSGGLVDVSSTGWN